MYHLKFFNFEETILPEKSNSINKIVAPKERINTRLMRKIKFVIDIPRASPRFLLSGAKSPMVINEITWL